MVSCREGPEGVVVWEWGEEDMLERKSVLYKSGFEPGVLNVDVKITLLVGWMESEGGAGKWSRRSIGGKEKVSSLYSIGVRAGQ